MAEFSDQAKISKRSFLRVENFDAMQNPKRPKRPTWIKSFVRDLDDPVHLSMTLAERGFLADFEKLAADRGNRVPDDRKFIATKLAVPPHVVGKSLATCIELGLISRFAEDLNLSRIKDMEQKIDTPSIPPSKSTSKSVSSTSNGRFDEVDNMSDIPF